MAKAKSKDKEEVVEDPNLVSKDQEKEIMTAVYQKIGGKPEDFYKSTITRVHQNSFRVNVYTCSKQSDSEYVKNYKIHDSVFYILP